MDAEHLIEEWRPVVGFEGYYSVSNLGRVRNDKTGRLRSINNRGAWGYVQICLSTNGNHRLFYVHVLVAEAFLGPRPHRHDVHHMNADRADNRLVNLEYITRSQNTLHAPNRGAPKGELKIPRRDMPSILARLAAGETMGSIAASYGVTGPSVSKRVSRYKMFSTVQREFAF